MAQQARIVVGDWWELDAAGLAERMKEEIAVDIANGVVPETVTGFGELHDWVDANCYGGVCDEDPPGVDRSSRDLMEPWFATIDAAQELVHQWLVSGGHRG